MKNKTNIALLLSACAVVGLLAGCTPAQPVVEATPTPVATPVSTPVETPDGSPAPSPGEVPPYKLVDRFLLDTKRELNQWLETDYGIVVYSYAGGAPEGNYYFLDLVGEDAVGLNLMRGVPQKDEYGTYPLPAEVMVDHDGALLHYSLDYPDRAVRNTAEGLEELPTGTYQIVVDLPTYEITITMPDGSILDGTQ